MAFWAKIVCSTLLVKYDGLTGELDLVNSTAPQPEREMPLPIHSPGNLFTFFYIQDIKKWLTAEKSTFKSSRLLASAPTTLSYHSW